MGRTRRAHLAIAWLLAACEGGDATLVVQVRTDLAPGLELGSVRVVVEGGPTRDTAASSARDWGLGVRVAELALPRGTHRLRVAALDGDGAVVVERPVRAELSGGVRVVTVLLTRDCAGVRCPGAGDDAEAVACVGGRCVLATCEEEGGVGCGAAECVAAASCGAAPSACAEVECTASGTCFEAPDHARCAAGEVCVLGDGCVPMDGADGGVPDDAGTCDSVPCGILPQCGCPTGDGCTWEPAVGLSCQAAGAGAHGAPCDERVDCAPGHECYVELGECARHCRMDAECAADERCAYFAADAPNGICIGDRCDPVTGAPCPAGSTCRLGDVLDAVSARFRLPICLPHGSIARSQPCEEPVDCAERLACTTTNGASFCRPYCGASADCGSAVSWCIPVDQSAPPGTPRTPPPGLCSDVCDPLAGSGCGTGTCRISFAIDFDGTTSFSVTLCAPSGVGADGAMCTTSNDCVAGHRCIGGSCYQYCDRAAPVCARGTCQEIAPAPTIGGITYGACN